MGWLRLVGSLRLHVSFAEYRLFYRDLLQERPMILRSLRIAATPCLYVFESCCQYKYVYAFESWIRRDYDTPRARSVSPVQVSTCIRVMTHHHDYDDQRRMTMMAALQMRNEFLSSSDPHAHIREYSILMTMMASLRMADENLSPSTFG